MPLNASLNLDDLPVQVRQSIENGMRSPRVVTLATGQVLFRFASSDSSPALWAAGAWWLFEHDYQKILAQHLISQKQHGADGLTLGYLGRVATAVKQGWSKTDVVVKAVVSQEINAFAGRGRPQYKERAPNGIYYTFSGWHDTEQIYIPNIGDRHGRTLLGYQALNIRRQKLVGSQQLFDRS
jgi:hypothetical protein